MRILFMGTPDIAAASLQALLDAGHEVCAVFTRRDKPVGRKQILTAPPVKQLRRSVESRSISPALCGTVLRMTSSRSWPRRSSWWWPTAASSRRSCCM